MFSTVLSATLRGLKVEFVHVEVDVSNGLPMFHMVGYLSSEVKEAAERVRTAIRNIGIKMPPKKIVINLSPATVKKRGASFDLPIAVAMLAAMECIDSIALEGSLIVGELSLDGRVQKVSGILPMVLEAKKSGYQTCVVPKENAAEGAIVDGMNVLGVSTLEEVFGYFAGDILLRPEITTVSSEKSGHYEDESLDFRNVQGQTLMKRATEVAVAGQHNLLFVGPPGAGKTMIAKCIPTIFPPLTLEESIEITKIYSVLGQVESKYPLITKRPFREVHHTVTKAALIGGGTIPIPGEISLATGGVLFLDELAEFPKAVIEALRQPLERHSIQITRSRGNYTFPADFMLISAMNPCPCGNYPNLDKCICTEYQIRSYLRKISQPFLDRLDICVEAPKVEYEDLTGNEVMESSATIRQRICRAREIQRQRYQGTQINNNGNLPPNELERYCKLGDTQRDVMKQAYKAYELTARTYHKILRVARTIADLEGTKQIEMNHLKEALGYRMMDQKYWR